MHSEADDGDQQPHRFDGKAAASNRPAMTAAPLGTSATRNWS